MRAYFDTNVYNMICDRDEAAEVQAFTREIGCVVLASEFNKLEIWRIPSLTKRKREANVIARVADRYAKQPIAYRHSLEVLRELRRLRSSWVRKIAWNKQARRFLKSHRANWDRIQRGWIPPKHAFAAYMRDAEPGIRRSKEFQKKLRNIQRTGDYSERTLIGPRTEETSRVSEIPLDDPEVGWRASCLMAWHEAIVGRSPASRDYVDYLGPYLRSEAFHDQASYEAFWLDEVDGGRMPSNRITGLAHHFQIDHKITRGNAFDTLHACHLLDVDVFVTGDQSFAVVLKDIANFVPVRARVEVIDRGAPRALQEIRDALIIS